jgi:hypothetical protein
VHTGKSFCGDGSSICMEPRHCKRAGCLRSSCWSGCWLLGKPGHRGPRRRALCALPRTPPGGGCWGCWLWYMTV